MGEILVPLVILCFLLFYLLAIFFQIFRQTLWKQWNIFAPSHCTANVVHTVTQWNFYHPFFLEHPFFIWFLFLRMFIFYIQIYLSIFIWQSFPPAPDFPPHSRMCHGHTMKHVFNPTDPVEALWGRPMSLPREILKWIQGLSHGALLCLHVDSMVFKTSNGLYALLLYTTSFCIRLLVKTIVCF